MVTLSSCLIWQIISFILPANEYGCVYAWIRLGKGHAIDLEKMPILAKKKIIIIRWSLFWSWRVCKQANLSHLGHRKSARIHWKADTPKTSNCLVRILVQTHNWAILLQARWEAVTVNDDRYRAMLMPSCHTAEATLDVLRPVFEDRIISRRSDVVWPPRSCDMTRLDYYL